MEEDFDSVLVALDADIDRAQGITNGTVETGLVDAIVPTADSTVYGRPSSRTEQLASKPKRPSQIP